MKPKKHLVEKIEKIEKVEKFQNCPNPFIRVKHLSEPTTRFHQSPKLKTRPQTAELVPLENIVTIGTIVTFVHPASTSRVPPE